MNFQLVNHKITSYFKETSYVSISSFPICSPSNPSKDVFSYSSLYYGVMPRIQNYNYYIIHLFSYTLKIAAFNACKVIDTFNLKAELKIKQRRSHMSFTIVDIYFYFNYGHWTSNNLLPAYVWFKIPTVLCLQIPHVILCKLVCFSKWVKLQQLWGSTLWPHAVVTGHSSIVSGL